MSAEVKQVYCVIVILCIGFRSPGFVSGSRLYPLALVSAWRSQCW